MYERLQQVVELCASMPRTVEHLGGALGVRRAATYRHVATGVQLGLLARRAPLRALPGLIVATREGHRWIGSGLAPARVTPPLVPHWISCSEIARALESEFPGARIISAAELQLEEAIEEKPIASAEVGSEANGSSRLHRPDLVVVNGERPLAIEVELTPKSPARLERIMRGWRRARCVRGVRYYAAAGTTRRAVERAIRKAHAGERVALLPVERPR